MEISNRSKNNEKWTKFGVYKQEIEAKLNLNFVLLYGREKMKTKTQTEHSRWNCKNSTSTPDAGISIPKRPVRPVGTARTAVPGVPGVCLKL